jgi:hypothetical protein
MATAAEVWEYTSVQVGTGLSDRNSLQALLNQLGSMGWEAVGISGLDKTLGLNGILVLLKRRTVAKPPPEDDSAGWKADPFGRWAMRYWDGVRWTEHVVKKAGGTTPEFDAPTG